MDWAFGMVTRDRQPKKALHLLREKLGQNDAVLPHRHLNQTPSVSIIVCSYNGAATLHACLESLGKIEYPKFEVILVDDGSTDNTAQIAAEFANVRYIHQPNRGLSAARNTGAAAARGEVLAYTDADCMADVDWLYYLIGTLTSGDFAGVGGPNVSPPAKTWVQACVAAAPGGPSHVLLTDTVAEHIPGCNMSAADLRALKNNPLKLKDVAPDVSRPTAAAIARMIAPDPPLRFHSHDAVIQALQKSKRILRGESEPWRAKAAVAIAAATLFMLVVFGWIFFVRTRAPANPAAMASATLSFDGNGDFDAGRRQIIDGNYPKARATFARLASETKNKQPIYDWALLNQAIAALLDQQDSIMPSASTTSPAAWPASAASSTCICTCRPAGRWGAPRRCARLSSRR